MTYNDQLNRTVILNKIPKRIISLVPSQTELLVDLGLESVIVGVTKFCIHPNTIRKSAGVVGGTKQVNLQKIKDLHPDLILCNKEENTKEMIASMATIAPIHISDVYNLNDCFELIHMYGDLFNVEAKALELIQAIAKERNRFKLLKQPIIKVAYFIWKNPWMVVASDNFIDEMLSEAGFVNVFKDQKRYPIIELNSPLLKEADVVLLSSEPFPFSAQDVLEFKTQCPETLIKIVDGELFSWYGSRLLQSYTYFNGLRNAIKKSIFP
ncbi:ABC transporter substrate-binding protein [Winogradskyella eckloniae]|uniref:ABC transporter substrate-binding protein n=1 Tax=Winogradskyella eckloniae TaxID=1089306 RepID=UPI0015642575|nr:helical backbone metal receptor [Winogradskyella eckloniae]NRD19567.1 ABC transporter substrate-binding protein [Winogradskyella eckloniae]